MLCHAFLQSNRRFVDVIILVQICLQSYYYGVRESGITLLTVVFIATAVAIYSLRHGLRIFTAVPRSTQPSSLRGSIK